MSKERELLEKLTATYFEIEDRGHACPLDDSEIESLMTDAREHLTATPAPQSESEAVRLLKSVSKAWVDDIDDGGEPSRTENAIASVHTFLCRPPGPDWRTLAEVAASRLDRCIIRLCANGMAIPDGTKKAEQDIRDALASEAAAAGKGDL